MFSFFALIAALGIYSKLESTNPITSDNKTAIKIKWSSETILPFLIFAGILSLCQASLLQSIGFYITDLFGNFENLPTLISMTFALLSISTIFSQYTVSYTHQTLPTIYSV